MFFISPTADKILRNHPFLRFATNRKRNLLGNITRKLRENESESDQDMGDLEELDLDLKRLCLEDSLFDEKRKNKEEHDEQDKFRDSSLGWSFEDNETLAVEKHS